MSFQMIRGGKSFGIALEMFEFFKSGKINTGYCWHEGKNEDVIMFHYVPAGTHPRHFLGVAQALNGDHCELRVHDVERDVPELDRRNRRVVEFFIDHEPREWKSEELRWVKFRLILIQYGDAGIWGFHAADLTKITVSGRRTITRYAMRDSIPHLKRPHLSRPPKTWALLGMSCPLYVVSQEVVSPGLDETIDAEYEND